MKKKNKTYLLLAVVLGIWGVIIYQFVGVFNPPSETVVETPSDAVFIPQKVQEREFFALALDYRDPFLGTAVAPKKKKSRPKKARAPKKEVPRKSIQFTGFIQQKNTAQKIFFVTVEGQQRMMKVNDTFNEVKLVKGSEHTIRVKYNGKTESIARSK